MGQGDFLEQVTFSGETSSGWQSMSFTNPVFIQPYTTYVAVVEMPNGHYSDDCTTLGFQSAGVDNPPLHAYQDNEFVGSGLTMGERNSGANMGDFYQLATSTTVSPVRNGLYSATSSLGWPTTTYHSCNYYVDVVFSN